VKRALAARVLSRTGLLAIASRAMAWSGVLILNYHRIGAARQSAFDRALWSADAAAFDAQVRFLASQFDVVTPNDLPDILGRRKGRFVLITFDDGYLDNYEVAFPILRRHGVPATFFVTTGFVDTQPLSWWDEIAWMVRTSRKSGIEAVAWLPAPVPFDEPDRERAVHALLNAYTAMPGDSTGAYLDALAAATGSGRWRAEQGSADWMTWDMLREMRAAGMVVGGHTVNHPVLAQLSADQQWEEISGCRRRIGEELGEQMRYFSYPVGGRESFNRDTRTCLRRAGVQYAFSYYGGFRTFAPSDDLDIPRIAIESYMDADWVRAVFLLPQVFGRAT